MIYNKKNEKKRKKILMIKIGIILFNEFIDPKLYFLIVPGRISYQTKNNMYQCQTRECKGQRKHIPSQDCSFQH